jgi:DNA-binding CsgD family transcriptional regulator
MRAACDQYFHDQIRRQTTLPAAAQLLAECAEVLGWDLAAFHADKDAVDLPRAHSGEFIAEMMGWPTECLNAWRDSGLGRHCPIAQLCTTATDPFPWDCDPKRNDWFGGTLQEPQRKVMDHYGRYVSGGIAVPVRLTGGQTGYVSWCSRKGLHRERSRQARLGSIFLISHTFIRQAGRLLAPEDGRNGANRLTSRERECLTWAARGKSEEEIAMIIERSRDTVHFHLRNASIKLNAGNRTHAVAIACTRGLISLR